MRSVYCSILKCLCQQMKCKKIPHNFHFLHTFQLNCYRLLQQTLVLDRCEWCLEKTLIQLTAQSKKKKAKKKFQKKKIYENRSHLNTVFQMSYIHCRQPVCDVIRRFGEKLCRFCNKMMMKERIFQKYTHSWIKKHDLKYIVYIWLPKKILHKIPSKKY